MRLTANRRIALNIAATYARNVYTLALGLVTARWLLLSLGQTDYGLLGVVGGLVAFVTFFNRLLAGSVSRFYALSIGRGKRRGGKAGGLAECRRWFTVAVSVHTVVPLVLLAIGYPVMVWVIEHVLVIPPERLSACLWVWRFACLSALAGMMNVPFRAMYTAKQEIAELTVLNVMNATLNAVLLYYMVTHPGDWLAKYAFWHCLLAILPRLFVCGRALVVYPECRIRRECLWNWADIRRLATFAGWTALGSCARLARTKGMVILVNLKFGPAQNAAVAVATRLASRTNTFAQSLITSFSPAIVAAYGAGNTSRMQGLVRRVSKLGATLVAAASVPLLLEVHEVMRLWLKKPPADSPFLCSCVLVAMFLNKMTSGERIAIGASGKLAAYQSGVAAINMSALVFAGIMFACGFGLEVVGWTSLGMATLNAVLRYLFSHAKAGLSIADGLRRVALPVLSVVGVAALTAALPRCLLAPSFGRILLTVGVCEAVLLPLAWRVVVDAEEREYIRAKVGKVRQRLSARREKSVAPRLSPATEES